jgi:hypothetical protein
MTTQTVSTSGSGLVFVNTYTANDTTQYINCIVAAEKALESLWTNTVTFNVTFDEQADGNTSFLASNSWPSWINVTYNQLTSALPAADALPNSDPTGGHAWSLPEAYARMLGLSSFAPSVDDTVTLNSSYNWNYGQDVINAIEHEISEGLMGRVGGLGDQNGVWSTMDLFRYSAPGVHDFTDGRDGKATYFSVSGSTLSSLSFNDEYNSRGIKVNSGDTADFAQQDVFGTGQPGETNPLSQTDIAIMDALGWTQNAPPTVSVSEIQNDYLAITRSALALDQATAIVNAINAALQTEAQYVNSLISQVANTTIPAVAVEATMYGAVGSSAEVTLLATQYLPPQVTAATAYGLNPTVYSSEALGFALNSTNESGSTAFANQFGPSNSAMPNSVAGDAAFAAAAASAVFGSAATANTTVAIQGWVSNWKAWYSANGLPNNGHPTADQIDLAARGAAWGDAVGNALASKAGPLYGQVTNFLQDAAQGIAVYSVSLANQPNPGSFQGQTPAASSSALADSHVPLIGVASHPDHAII